jgi:hypothetical protein
MPSKIKKFNFNGCQHLRKLVISDGVEFEGKIDLSDTPITKKNDIHEVNVVDPEHEGTSQFKDAPDGITSNLDNLNKIRLRGGTTPTGKSVETQTDNINLNESRGKLTGFDKKAMELMDDNLFWFDTLKKTGRKEYLEQRREDLKNFLNKGDAQYNLTDSIRLLAEHVLLINEKILENADYFDEMGNIINPSMSTPKKRKWSTFYGFLTIELLEQDNLLYKFKKNEDIKENIRNELKTRLNATGDNLTDWINTNISSKTLERFMLTLEATIDKDGSKYWTFPDYDDDWYFEDYFNNDSKRIGFKTETKGISESGLKVLKAVFEYWKEVYSGSTPPPSTSSSDDNISLNSYEKQAIRNIFQKGSYDNWKDLEGNTSELKAVLEQINDNIRTFKKYGTIDKIKEV